MVNLDQLQSLIAAVELDVYANDPDVENNNTLLLLACQVDKGRTNKRLFQNISISNKRCIAVLSGNSDASPPEPLSQQFFFTRFQLANCGESFQSS